MQNLGMLTPSARNRITIQPSGGAATFDEAFLKRRRQQLAQDDEEIMIFVKAFLTQYGTD